MSVNKHFRQTWIQLRYREAVKLFHEQRILEANAHRDLVELARACAVTIFSEHAHTIVGDRDVAVNEFMAYVRENISDEINAAILEPEPEEELVA